MELIDTECQNLAESRNPFVNQVFGVLKEEEDEQFREASRNPFVNQVFGVKKRRMEWIHPGRGEGRNPFVNQVFGVKKRVKDEFGQPVRVVSQSLRKSGLWRRVWHGAAARLRSLLVAIPS